MNVTHPESLLFWSVLIFAILLFLLAKFAWRPITEAVRKREDFISNSLAKAREAQDRLENIKKESEQLLEEARAESDKILKEARALKDVLVNQATTTAKHEGDKLIANARLAIETEKEKALQDVKKHIAKLSVEIAEKVVRDELSDRKRQERLIEDILKNTKIS